MLSDMFRKNSDVLTQSTLKEVVQENKGDLDKCVGTFSLYSNSYYKLILFIALFRLYWQHFLFFVPTICAENGSCLGRVCSDTAVCVATHV